MADLTPDEIEAHAAAIRALALRLVGDTHRAEDVAQSALQVALESDAPRGERFGRWLRGVGRNLSRRAVRTDSRRRRREESTQPRPASPTADEIVARTETRHRVVAELLRLDEPYRQTLLLRFFEGLEPTEIARRDGVPAATVRSRLKRGLALLRGRLDDTHGGSRAAWLAPLVVGLQELRPPPPVGAGGPSPPASPVTTTAALTVGVLTMSWKLIAAGVGVVVLAGAAWLLNDDAAEPDPPAPPAEAASETPPPAPVERPRDTPEELAAEAVEESSPEPAPEAVDPDLWVIGRVLGNNRFPAVGVEVALVTQQSDPATTTTDADGRYRLPAAAPPPGGDALAVTGMIHARSGDGAAAATPAHLTQASDGVLEIQTLVLGPARPLAILVETVNGAVEGAVVTLGNPYRLMLAHTGSSGEARFEDVPEGDTVVQAYHPELGRAHARVAAGSQDRGPIRLTLERRDLLVRTVRSESQEPVADVPLQVTFTIRTPAVSYPTLYDPPLGVLSTDADGAATLTVGAEDRIRIIASPAQALSGSQRFLPSASVRTGETEAVIEIPLPRTFRWRLVPGEAPPPAEGETVELLDFTNSGQSAPAETAVVRDAHLVIENVPRTSVNCYARTADGRMARLYANAKDTEPRDAKFRQERHIEVRVTRADGSPVEGAWILARDQGNNAIRPAQPTDAAGLVRIGKLFGRLADVQLIPSPAQPWSGTRIGSVDLEQGSGSLEFTIPEHRRATLRITCDGKPSLPSQYVVVGKIEVVEEDPAAGTIVVEFAPPASGGALPTRMQATGFSDLAFELPANPGAEAVHVALRSGAGVRGRIRQATDGKGGADVERWDDARGLWVHVNLQRGPRIGRVTLGDQVTGRDLDPGRYRLRDRTTGLATAPVDVAAGEVGDLGELDLSRTGFVKGTVTVPEGSNVKGARVVVEGDGMDPIAAGFGNTLGQVRADGSYSVRVPGDRVVKLRVEHPTLRTAAGGVTELTNPRSDLVLALERGPVLRVQAQEELKPQYGAPPRALYFVGDPTDQPVFERTCRLVDGGLVVGAPPPGRYTLWLDVAPWAPLVVRDVAVGDADIDLGGREFPVGSSIQVRVLVGDGQAAPRLMVSASHEAHPVYWRGLNSSGEKDVVLAGLGPGKFRVHCLPILGSGPPTRVLHEVEIDGAAGTVHEIELDLR